MRGKIGKLSIWIILMVVCGVCLWFFDCKDYGIAEAFAAGFMGYVLPKMCLSIQDLFDNTNWKSSQQKLKREKIINNHTSVRISFAYLFRINVGDKYLLVQNKRKTGKYQPVGGVYKMEENEKLELKNRFHVKEDDKISVDEASKNDYRLQMENRYLRRFVRRFDSKKADRERISDVSREFKEELVDMGILDWKRIRYRVCGRYMTELRFVEHFQMYELMIVDVVEIILNEKQKSDLEALLRDPLDTCRFATEKEINSLGVDTDKGDLSEWIGDHTKCILQGNEGKLLKIPEYGKEYEVEVL